MRPRPLGAFTLSALLTLAMGFSDLRALAQPAGSTSYGQPAPTSTEVPASEKLPLTLSVQRLGVGDCLRPGEWAGVQVQLVNTAADFPNVVLKLELPDRDGDTAQYRTTVTASPGAPQRVWLYAKMPFELQDLVLSITAHEAQEGAGGVRAGRLLGKLDFRVPESKLIEATQGLMGVVGKSPMGLMYYALPARVGAQYPALGHELVRTLVGLTPAELPDRWMGYGVMGTLVWAGSGGEGEPTDLSEAQAAALRTWVMRGGHLVVVLPQVGTGWMAPSNPLTDILPNVHVDRRESTDLNTYARLLCNRERTLPERAVVHTFEPRAGARPGEADRVLSGPDGACVVVRRLSGAGAVTMIGLDLTSGGLAGLDAVAPDNFWHRVLGRRGVVYRPDEQANEDKKGNLNAVSSRVPWTLDGDVLAQIDQTGRSALGVLMAFVAFVLYWVVAGPVCFAALKRRGLSQHAWVTFVGAIGVFTLIAWGGAALLKQRRYEARHVTLLDWVYGQPIARARGWVSVLLPTYGDVALSVDASALLRGGSAVSPWSPLERFATRTKYPDARGYPIDARQPDSMDVPARSTIKSLQADWAGETSWKLPIPVTGPSGESAELTIERFGVPREGRSFRVNGSLRNDLDKPIQNVMIVVVSRQSPLRALRKDPPPEYLRDDLLADQTAVRLTDEWKPGQTIDLGALLDSIPARRSGEQSGLEQQLDTLIGFDSSLAGVAGVTPATFRGRMIASALFPMLPPPDKSLDKTQVACQRVQTQGLDLGRWFTQPCVMVLGFVADSPSPLPLRHDGQPLSSTGLTMVRCVYPLPDSPPGLAE